MFKNRPTGLSATHSSAIIVDLVSTCTFKTLIVKAHESIPVHVVGFYNLEGILNSNINIMNGKLITIATFICIYVHV